MKIVLDARTVRPGMSGVGYYTARLASSLPSACPDAHFLFLSLRGYASSLLPMVRGANVEWIETDADYESHPAGDWWEHRVLPRLLDEWDANVFHGPAFLLPFRPLRLPVFFHPPRAARVVTIHDLSTFTMPEAYPVLFGFYLRQVIRHSLEAADRVIVPSGFVRDEILSRWPSFSPEKFAVAPHGPAAFFSPTPPDHPDALRALHDLPERFLLMVGTFERRKNPVFFRGLYEALAARLGASVPPLIWVGRPGFGSEEARAALEPLRRAGLFRLIESVEQSALSAFYHTATLLAYPSWNEGFGLPVLEAMACGLPVLVSDRACLPEVAGSGGRVLPLETPGAWAETIGKLLESPALLSEARARALERASYFSWEKTARRTAEVYCAAAVRREKAG